MSADPDDVARAWGWVAALRAGSVTPWSEWRARGETGPATARDLPGAQQLELVRRINLAAPVQHPTRADLVERVLTASATGRGTPDLELVDVGPERSWGFAPVDPESLAEHALLRVAATLLAEDLVSAASAHRGATPALATLPLRARRRLRRRGAGHRVVGDPWLALSVRDELLRTGRPLGGPASPTVVVGRDAASMLVDVFTARAFDEGGPRWGRWLRSGPGQSLPRRADLALVARTWSHHVGHAGVVVVPDPAQLPSVLGLPERAAPRLQPPLVSADATDLARRVSAALGLLVPPERRRRLLRQGLLPRLLDDGVRHPAAPLAVPDDRVPWVARRAEQMREEILAAGYPVVGDLHRLVPAVGGPRASGAGPDDAGVLALAVRLLVAGPGSHPERTRGR